MDCYVVVSAMRVLYDCLPCFCMRWGRCMEDFFFLNLIVHYKHVSHVALAVPLLPHFIKQSYFPGIVQTKSAVR